MENEIKSTVNDLIRQVEKGNWTQVGSIIDELHEMSESDEFPSDL